MADIRIYTPDKQNVEPLLTSAGLLQNIGTWQVIHFVANEQSVEKLSSHLLELLNSYASTKGKQCAIVFDNKLYESKPEAIEEAPENLGEEFFIRDISQREAKFIVKLWIPETLEYPLQYRIKYVEGMISNLGIKGIYSAEEDRYPVSWIGRRPGGEIGLAYSLKEYHHNHLKVNLRHVSVSAFIPKSKSLFFTLPASFHGVYFTQSVGYRCTIAIF